MYKKNSKKLKINKRILPFLLIAILNVFILSVYFVTISPTITSSTVPGESNASLGPVPVFTCLGRDKRGRQYTVPCFGNNQCGVNVSERPGHPTEPGSGGGDPVWGAFCGKFFCNIDCTWDEECADGLVCDSEGSGTCRNPNNLTSAVCGSGDVMCDGACTNDADCSGGLTCYAATGTCRNPENPTSKTCTYASCNESCAHDFECKGDNICNQGGKCVHPEYYDVNGYGTLHIFINARKDCRLNHCGEGCSEDAHCTGDMKCGDQPGTTNYLKCYNPDYPGNEFVNSITCSPAECNQACRSNVDCANGLSCDAASNTCRNPLNPTSETCSAPVEKKTVSCNQECNDTNLLCPEGLSCTDQGVCRMDANPTSETCELSTCNQACTTDASCSGEGLFCNDDGVCRMVDNPESVTCVHSVCNEACTSDANCGEDGHICNPDTNTCRHADYPDSSTCTGSIELKLTKDDGKTEVEAGETITYVINVANEGNLDAAGVTVKDTLPPQLEYQSSDNGGQNTGLEITWDNLDIPAGDDVDLRVTVKVQNPLTTGTTTLNNVAVIEHESCQAGDENCEASDEDFVRNICGDGIVAEGESCDDGNLTDGDGCSSTCSLPSCGDGVVDAGEQCDGGANCNDSCVLISCGDGIVNGSEQCDNGTLNGVRCNISGASGSCDYCSSQCTNTTHTVNAVNPVTPPPPSTVTETPDPVDEVENPVVITDPIDEVIDPVNPAQPLPDTSVIGMSIRNVSLILLSLSMMILGYSVYVMGGTNIEVLNNRVRQLIYRITIRR